MKIVVMILSYLLILAFSGGVFAQGDSFERADANKDGYINIDEYNAAVNSKFNEYDSNKDGVIDKNEFNSNKDKKAALEFEFLDRDKNGKLNMEEFKAGAAARYQMYDQNRDGLLGKSEYKKDTGFSVLKFYF